jgi:multicomponent Na+:H+ antiporter subunit D
METGLLGAFYTGDIFTFFVFIELLVLSSVGLTAMSDNRLGVEAAMKYLFINGMGSMFLLMGIGALYTSYGTLNMADIAVSIQLGGRVLMATLAMVALTCSFMLKSADLPLPLLATDFHTTSPTPVSAMLSSVIVKIGIYGLIRLVTLLFIEEGTLIRMALGWLGVISIFLGSLSALRTYNGKRLLAFSTSAQIGYVLLGIGWNTPTALAAAILFAFNHAFVKSAMLMLYGVVASRNQAKTVDFEYIVGMGHALPLCALGIFAGRDGVWQACPP